MAYFKKTEAQYKLTTADYRELSRLTHSKLLKNGIAGYSDIMIRNFYLHGYTCSEAMKEEILTYIKNKQYEKSLT